jgi:hypothetical protein
LFNRYLRITKISEKYKLDTCYFTDIFTVCKIFDNISVYTMQETETFCKSDAQSKEILNFFSNEYLKDTFLITEKDDISLALKNFLSSISVINQYYKSKSTLNHKPIFLESNSVKTFQYEYMKVASDFKTGVIVIDIDEKVADIIELRILTNSDAPLPNLIIKNHINKHVQLFYFLENWVCIDNSNTYKNYSEKAHNFYRLIKKRLNEVLTGDTCYHNYICKNPLFKNASLSTMRLQKYSLSELARITDLKVENYYNYISNTVSKKIKKSNNIVGIGQRNNIIFETMRHHAYSLYSSNVKLSEDELAEILLNECKAFNKRVCNPPLPDSEVEIISASISNFCAGNFNCSNNRENKLEIAKKAGKAGGKAKGKSYELQKKRVIKLHKNGMRAKFIATEVGLSIRTVYEVIKLKNPHFLSKNNP